MTKDQAFEAWRRFRDMGYHCVVNEFDNPGSYYVMVTSVLRDGDKFLVESVVREDGSVASQS